MKGDIKKWRKNFIRFKKWDTPSQRHVQKIEAETILRWLLEKDLDSYDILEIGCGNGYLGKIISEGLYNKGVKFSYTFTDLIPECIQLSKDTIKESAVRNENLNFVELDIYKGSEVLGQNSQDIIISTGFASAATYRDAIPEVSKLLKKGGIFISDFVNDLSPIVFLSHPLTSIKLFWKFIVRDSKEPHYIGIIGLRLFFEKFNLKMEKYKYIRFRKNPILCIFKKT